MSRPKSDGKIARHRVRDEIQALILSGEFVADQRLTQQDLAKRFSVAQTVVREALLELQFSGLVRAVDNLGIFVAPMGIEQILDAYQIREMLEGLAVRLCCQQVCRLDVQELEDLAQQIHHHGQLGEYRQMAMLDRQFHERIIKISASGMLNRLIEGYRVFGMAIWAQRDIDTVYKEHIAIVQAFGANKPQEAERLAREHVQAAHQSLKKRVACGEVKPDWVIGDLIQLQKENAE